MCHQKQYNIGLYFRHGLDLREVYNRSMDFDDIGFGDISYIFDPKTNYYYLYVLTVPNKYIAGDIKYTIDRDIGYCFQCMSVLKTKDLRHFDNLRINIIQASQRNKSIWYGHPFFYKKKNKIVMFYTERGDSKWLNPVTKREETSLEMQSLRIALSGNFLDWQPIDEKFELLPQDFRDQNGKMIFSSHRRATSENNKEIFRTAHGFRDACYFEYNNEQFALMFTVSNDITVSASKAGCLSLFKIDPCLTKWTLVTDKLIGGFEELETPHVFESKHGDIVIFFWKWCDDDYKRSTANYQIRTRGECYLGIIKGSEFLDIISKRKKYPNQAHVELISGDTGLFAGPLIPDGPSGPIILGYKVSDGPGLNRSIGSYSHLNKDVRLFISSLKTLTPDRVLAIDSRQ